MALNPKKKLRVNGQLVETTDEDLRSLASKQGLPTPPTSPAGAVGAGANQDVAKMAGTQQQRQAAVSVPLKTQDTLAGAQRLDQPRQQQSDAERQAAGQASKLQNLEGLDTRVQALVGQQLASIQSQAANQTRFNQAQLDTLAPDVDRAGVEGLLSQYQQLNNQLRDPNLPPESKTQLQAQAFQILADLRNQHGISNPDDYLDVSASSIGQTAAESVIDPAEVTLDTLDLSQLGMDTEELDSLFGPGWRSLSVGEFSQRVEDLRQAEYQRINSLRSQLATLAPGSAQREAILRELGDAAQVGVTGVEDQMRRTAEQVNLAETVVFAGQRMKVGDLLKDEQISQFVADYLNPAGSPQFREALEKQHPEFVSWINQNKESLSALSEEMRRSGSGFEKVQEQQKALASVGDGVSLSDAVMKTLVPGWGQAVAQVSDLSGNSVYAALTDQNTSTADRSSIANKLNASPEMAERLANLSPDQVVAAHHAAEKLESDTALQRLVGGSADGGFLLDGEANQKLQYFAPLIDKLRRSGDQFQTLLEDNTFLDLLRTGELDHENIDQLIKNPRALQQYQDYKNLIDQFQNIESRGDIDAALQFMFGHDGVSEQGLSQMFAQARQLYMLDPTDPDISRRYEELKSIFGDDGVLSDQEKASLMDRIRAALNQGVTLDDALAGKGMDFSLRKEVSGRVQPGAELRAGSFAETIKSALADGHVSFEEIQNLPAAYRDKLFNMPEWWRKQNRVISQHYYQTRQASEEYDKALRAANSNMQYLLSSLGYDPSKMWTLNNSRLNDTQVQQLTNVLNAIKGRTGYEKWEKEISGILAHDANEKEKERKRIADLQNQYKDLILNSPLWNNDITFRTINSRPGELENLVNSWISNGYSLANLKKVLGY